MVGGTPLAITTTPHAGRSYCATEKLIAGTCVLDISTPYACTLYKQFRNEVCAECWKYDGGRRSFLTCREFGENAGLLFCDERCGDAWLQREGSEMVELLKTLESARKRRAKGKENATEADLTVPLSQDRLNQTWGAIAARQKNVKEVKQWRQIQLDDFQADMARYVLMALYHYARESCEVSQSLGIFDAVQRYAACWSDFVALQSNELRQISKFPELLDDHIKIFQVLRARFGHYDGTCASPTLRRFAEVISTANVRVALGVDPGNSFGIWEVPITDESEGLGFAVYPVPSFFNHHCAPSVLKQRAGRRLKFITTREVEANEALSISYGNVKTMDLPRRQKELREGWFFECRCSRCMDDLQQAHNELQASIMDSWKPNVYDHLVVGRTLRQVQCGEDLTEETARER